MVDLDNVPRAATCAGLADHTVSDSEDRTQLRGHEVDPLVAPTVWFRCVEGGVELRDVGVLREHELTHRDGCGSG